jgi:hypothetical protein
MDPPTTLLSLPCSRAHPWWAQAAGGAGTTSRLPVAPSGPPRPHFFPRKDGAVPAASPTTSPIRASSAPWRRWLQSWSHRHMSRPWHTRSGRSPDWACAAPASCYGDARSGLLLAPAAVAALPPPGVVLRGHDQDASGAAWGRPAACQWGTEERKNMRAIWPFPGHEVCFGKTHSLLARNN